MSTLKQRTVSQLQSLRESEEDRPGENIDLRKTADNSRRNSEEKRKSLEERNHPSTSATEEGKGKSNIDSNILESKLFLFSETPVPSTSSGSKRLSPLDKLRETLLSFERSLNMLLQDLGKNEEDKAPDEANEDNQNNSDKKEDKTEVPTTEASSSK